MLADSCLLMVSSHDAVETTSSHVSFIRALNPIHEGSTLMIYYFPKAPPANITAVRVRITTYE